jgi:hypothetical protein
MVDAVLSVAVGLLVVWMLVAVPWRGRATARELRGLPGELENAEIAYAECTFRSPGTRLVARIDRAYRLGCELTLVELKTRSRNVVYPSDVVEASVQRIAMQDETGERVCAHAWIVVQCGEAAFRNAYRVDLLERAEIVRMVNRYRLVVATDSPAELHGAHSAKACRLCGHRDQCQRPLNEH